MTEAESVALRAAASVYDVASQINRGLGEGVCDLERIKNMSVATLSIWGAELLDSEVWKRLPVAFSQLEEHEIRRRLLALADLLDVSVDQKTLDLAVKDGMMDQICFRDQLKDELRDAVSVLKKVRPHPQNIRVG